MTLAQDGAAAPASIPFEALYRASADDAWRVARAVTGNDHDASDAVAEAVSRVFLAVSTGRMASIDDFRSYLLAAARNAAVDIVRGTARTLATAEPGPFDAMVLSPGPSDRAVADDDCAFVARAFTELPPRWQSVLWLTEVEELAPREAADVLGLTSNNVSQLAARARARLRERYLQGHVAAGAAPECRTTVPHLGAYAAGQLPRRRKAAVAAHLEGCRACRDRVEQLDDLGLVLRRTPLPFPALLAGAGVGWRARLFGRRRGSSADGSQAPPSAAPAATAADRIGAVVGSVDPGAVGLLQQLAGSPVGQAVAATAAVALIAVGVAGVVSDDRPAAVPPPQVASVPVAEPAPTTTTAAPAPPAEPATTVAPPAPVPPPATAAPARAAAPAQPVLARTSTVAEGVAGVVGVADTPGGGAVRSLDHPQPSGAPLVMLVLEEQGEWLRVLLPVRPNGSTGWVHASDVALRTHDYQIVIELGAHRLSVYEGGVLAMRETIAVGTADAPTPGGLFYTTALVEPLDAAGRYDPNGPYGPFAYELSGFSEVLSTFAGGDGRLGLHGTNDPASLGGDVSHGCIRMSNAAIRRLAAVLPLGVPVDVVA